MIKVGIIGAGRIGKVHAESIMKYVPNATIKTVADPFLNNDTIKFMKNLGIKKFTKNYKDILRDKEIDAVLICSSTNTHFPISMEAIKAGKHIFCEKPVDPDPANIRKVMAALKGKKIKYQVGFNRRFDHNFMAVREAIEKGKIGKLEVLKVCSRDPAAPPVSYIKVSGGIFLDMTIHDFDMVRFLSGKEIKEIFVMGGVMVDPAIKKAGDIDTAVISMRLSDGSLAVIDNCRRAAYGYDQRVEAFGEKGQIAVGNDTVSTAVLSNANGVTGEKPLYFFLERYMRAYSLEIIKFFECIQKNKPVPAGIKDGLASVLIGRAATKSCKTGKPVKVEKI